MNSPAATHQSSPSHQKPYIKKADEVCLNIRGDKHYLPHSFLKRYPQTLLGRIASEHDADPAKEVVLDCIYFQMVLGYLRDDGKAVLPITVSRSSFLDELAYFEIKNIDESKIVSEYHFFPNQSQTVIKKGTRSEIESWDGHDAIAILSRKCASICVAGTGKLHFDICGPRMLPSFKKDSARCSHNIWMELLALLNNKEMKLLPQDQDKCNQYLCKVGLKVSSVMLCQRKHIIQVVMQYI